MICSTIMPAFETFSFGENNFLSYGRVLSHILIIFAMCNISLKKRSRNGTAFVRYSACRIRSRYKDLSMMSFALSTCEVSSEAR